MQKIIILVEIYPNVLLLSFCIAFLFPSISAFDWYRTVSTQSVSHVSTFLRRSETFVAIGP
jgi:hypothetical protein